MPDKGNKAPIKIKKLLDSGDWHFFADGDWSSPTVKIVQDTLARVWGKRR
jgi:hypothetical protein